MTKAEILRFLEPFTDEIEIKVRAQIANPPLDVSVSNPAYVPSFGTDDAYVTLVLEHYPS
jgi:hypothetical protein